MRVVLETPDCENGLTFARDEAASVPGCTGEDIVATDYHWRRP
jgi:hypothetical protein